MDTQPFNNETSLRVLRIVRAMGKSIRKRASAEQNAIFQKSVIETDFSALRESLARPSREATRLRKEVARLEQSLSTSTAGGSHQSSKKHAADRTYLEQTLAHKNKAIRLANEQIAAGQIDINGQKLLAHDLLVDMASRERELYDTINQRHPWLAILIALFGDAVAKDREELEKRIDLVRKEYKRQTSELEALRARLEEERDEAARLLQQLQDSSTLAQRQQQISNKVLESRKKELAEVEANDLSVAEQAIAAGQEQRTQQMEALNSRWQDDRTANEKSVQQALEQLTAEARRLQGELPLPLATIPPASLLPQQFPEELLIDFLAFDDEAGNRIQVPRTISFPLPAALRFTRTNKHSTSAVHTLLLRLCTGLPANALTIQVIDPLELGASLGPLKRLIKRPGPFWGREVCTRADDIERALSREVDRLEELVQDTFRDGPDSWTQYNKLHPDTRLPYRVVLIFDAPEQLTDKAIVYLQRLVEQGPRRGILPIVIEAVRPSDLRRGQQLAASLEDRASEFMAARESFSQAVATSLDAFARPLPGAEETPSPESLESMLDGLVTAYESLLNRTSPITALWPDEAFWKSVPSEGLVIPLGWTRDGDGVALELGRPGSTRIHALVAGRSGSGKSSLLHVLLHSLCHRYSPEHVRVFLLDYKQGIEMAAYADPPLPHADLVSTDSDIAFGLTVMQHIESECKRRADLFQKARVASIDQYCIDGRSLPRLMLLIDEFQVLFSGDASTTREVEKLLSTLLKQGRAYGLHVVLCTQTLSGINSSVSLSQLKSQIGERLCLACDPQDSAKILDSGNEEGARLSGPPEAILNSANGLVDGNRLFLFPQPIPGACQSHLDFLVSSAARRGTLQRPRIFRGDQTLPIPEPAAPVFEELTPSHAQIVIGNTLSFVEESLRVDMTRRAGMHLLLVGHLEQVRDGLLYAALQSLVRSDRLRTVMVYNCSENPGWDTGFFSLHTEAAITILPATWSGDLSALPQLESGDSGLFIVDGLDLDRAIRYSRTTASRPVASGQNPQAAIADFFESGHKRGWRMIATATNWRRLDSLERRDLLGEFQVRIGFGLTEEEYSKLACTGSRLPTVAAGPSRAILINHYSGTVVPFRPFVSTTVT